MRKSFLIALLAGLASVFAFAPYGYWPLAVVSPALLLLVLKHRGPREALLIGWAYGLGMFGYGVWWLQVSVHQFGVPYYVFSVGVTAVFIAGMALYPALFAMLWCRFGTPGAKSVLLAPGLWVLTEYLRGWLFTGFPWLALGYSQLDSPLAGFAPVLGVFGCSVVVMLQAVCLFKLCESNWRGGGLAVSGLVVTTVLGMLLLRVEFTDIETPDLEVALIQGAIPQDLKWRRDLRAASVAVYRSLNEPHWDADVVIWPETAIAAFPHEVVELLAELDSQARAHNTDLLIGMPSGEPWNGVYFNSVIDLGTTPGQYDKRHLVPFGEFFPFKDLISGVAMLLDIPMSDFSAGKAGQATLEVAGHRAGISICYEDAFGGEVIEGLPEAAFLINVSNDAWFGDTIAPHQHLQIARMRALETGRYLLRATNTGITAVIDHRGRITASAQAFSATTLRAGFAARSGATPYVRWGDVPVVLLVVLLTLAGARWRSGATTQPG